MDLQPNRKGRRLLGLLRLALDLAPMCSMHGRFLALQLSVDGRVILADWHTGAIIVAVQVKAFIPIPHHCVIAQNLLCFFKQHGRYPIGRGLYSIFRRSFLALFHRAGEQGVLTMFCYNGLDVQGCFGITHYFFASMHSL